MNTQDKPKSSAQLVKEWLQKPATPTQPPVPPALRVKRIPGSALERGQLVRNVTDATTLAQYPENRQLVAQMYARFRFERVMTLERNAQTGKWVPGKPTEEWVIVGVHGQCYEVGPLRLGITVASTRMIYKLQDAGLEAKQMGEREANFVVSWTPENIERVAALIKLRVRREAWRQKRAGTGQTA